MSAKQHSVVTSLGESENTAHMEELSRLREELRRSKLEHELLRWENSAKEEEAQKLRHRVDSEIEFRLPSDTSGYVSYGARPMSSSDMSPAVDSKKQVSFGETHFVSDSVSGIPSRAESTPVAKTRKEDELDLFLASPPAKGQGSPSRNPFTEEREKSIPKQLYSELLSFATRIGEGCTSELPGKVETPSVGPWPLKRESRVTDEKEMLERVGRKSQRPNIIPDRYNGKVPWKEYFRHFQSCREVNQWSDEQSASYLAASLQGTALRILGDRCTSENKPTYGELVKLLERRFGSSQQAENYLVELRHRRQGPKESLQELGQAVREMTVKAYPEIQEDARDRLAKNHFIDAVDSHSVREGIYRARPKNLDEAIQAALETENIEKVERQRVLDRKAPKLARALDGGTEQRFEQIEQKMSQIEGNISTVVGLLSQLTKRDQGEEAPVGVPPKKSKNPQGVARSSFKCYNCGGKGHFAKDCKKPPKKDQGNGGQPNGGPAGRLDTLKGPQQGNATEVTTKKVSKEQKTDTE